MNLKDMSKLESPFEREEINGDYVCVPKFKQEFKWILDKNIVLATEKFDGTNVSVSIEDGYIKKVLNRTNNIDLWKSNIHFYLGIKRAIDEKKFKLDMVSDGQYFGELLGPKINGNYQELESPLWLPFDYIKEHYYFKFYYNWLDEIQKNPNTEETLFNHFSELFKSLKSLWFRQKGGQEKQPEGIVFYNKLTGEMCKLRCDMFDWYSGKRHKQKEFEDKQESNKQQIFIKEGLI